MGLAQKACGRTRECLDADSFVKTQSRLGAHTARDAEEENAQASCARGACPKMRPSTTRPLCLRPLSGKLMWPFLPSTSTTCSTHLDHGGMLPRPLMTGAASCLGLQLTGGGNSIKLPSRKSHPRIRTQHAFASYATMPLGGDLASTCMHARSTKDASMQASFPNPSDRAVHRREPLRNPARWLLPCCQGLGWIGLLILLTPPSPLFHCHHRQGRGYLPKTSRCRTFSVRRMLAITLLLSSAKVSQSRCCPRSNLLSCAQLLISLSSNGATCSWP